ncbi:flagellar hook-basal body protein [Sporosarcina pasteurii]|uniref:Distal rod protein n=1 Tax=Sporosarcina pasteurii TaxID=1474 RepID=A0A380BCR4_SPOPA|nr:flagellar hook-basal body protein [Sporosarcina pasteurii]MDS9472261.1 flagellar hook-basal body protein [Sporosarcina pasteurii]QBQ06243.1 flagellar hook-basal body protein [Sporosarcina pasteurii]SUI99117.1 Distal rod protein [Sporosarcina pasteurii]
MFRGFYTVASGMIAQQRRTEMLTNNMANVNTPGFKAEQSSIRSFPEMLLSSVQSTRIPTENGFNLKGVAPIGPLSTGVYMQETLPLFIQGQLQETELTTDVALVDGFLPTDEETGIQGTIFFTLENDEGGTYYTRNGNFALDANGLLTSPAGYYVLDSNGNRITLQGDDFRVTESGVIMENDNVVATLGISFAARPDTLMKQGEGLFVTENGDNLMTVNNIPDVTYSIQQGFVERSNVDAGRTMTDLLTAYRAFEANQKVLQAYDRSMEKAVNEVGKV